MAHFFLDDCIPQTADMTVKSLLKQLVCQQQKVPPALKKVYEERSHEIGTDGEMFKSIFVQVCRDFTRVYIILDGVNRYPDAERDKLYGYFKELSGTGLRLYFTTRGKDRMEVRKIFGGLAGYFEEPIVPNNDEFESFIEYTLKRNNIPFEKTTVDVIKKSSSYHLSFFSH
jgi:hypothetical protein